MAKNIVTIGGGPAAAFAAMEAKRRDATAHVTLVTDESCEPYEKPPLSKAVLLGKANPEDAPIAGPGGLAKHGVAVRHNARCTGIDRTAREVVTAQDRLPYDALVIATGSVMRELPMLPQGMARVHYLRTDAQARALKAQLAGAGHVVVIGAGLIGLEVAASANELGRQVTVIEFAPRIMARACDPDTGELIAKEHAQRGVDIRLGTSVAHASAQPDGIAIETDKGETLVADLVVVGTGVKPDDALAGAAGLKIDDGVVVDAQCRTSDPTIFAAGDCTRFPGPGGSVRLENWRHAQDHGALAGRNAAGASDAYSTVPSYWTEQYDLYVQGLGWPESAPDARVRRPLAGKGTLLMETKGGVIVHAIGINAQRDLAAVRRLIERRVPVDPAALADPAQPFNAMLKAKA
jgi:3-phenylpropionate/trans-cinnamate dioxygenase ferredoxin reductase component